MPSVSAVIVAAGRGSRAGTGAPKQYRRLAGRAVIAHVLETFLVHSGLRRVVTVIHRDDGHAYRAAIAGLPALFPARLMAPVSGGETRQASVRAGLERLAQDAATADPDDIVLIHDAARPFVTPALIDAAIAAGLLHGAAVPGVAVTDTVKVVGPDAFVTDTPDRAALRAIQTPQAFRFDQLLDAHRRAAAGGLSGFTDDGAIAEWAGARVHVFDGDGNNVKLTTEADFASVEARMVQQTPMIPRAGMGYDVHAFTSGDHIWLGGIKIAHDRGILAHSDGDVVLHALTDAVLGALSEGDIGVHFPPGDPRWKNAPSDRFLAFAVGRIAARGGILDHVDVTVVCEAPKLTPHRDAIRAHIATIAGLPVSAVSIKATTSEGLGFTGRREGIAAQAIVSLRMPKEDRQDG